MKRRRRLATASLLALAVAACGGAAAAPRYEVVADGRAQGYTPLQRADKPWRICALLPQGRDKFWWGVSWGLSEQARQLGVELGLYVADSYADLAGQRRHWAECRARGAQAYVLAAVTTSGLNAEIAAAMAEGRPVIDLINGVSAQVSSHSVNDAKALGKLTADYLLRDAKGRAISLAWFAGPQDARWAEDAEQGLLARLHGHPVQLRQGGRGPTDLQRQSTLVREHLERAGTPDYIVGNAVAVEFAARLLPRLPPPRPTLLAYYATEEILARIASGEVLAAPCSQPVIQARIGLDLAVRALQGQALPQQLSVAPLMVDRQSLPRLNRQVMMAPPGQRLLQRRLPALQPTASAAASR